MGDHIIDRVSDERWRQAQAWEQEAWVSTEKARARWGKNFIWKLLAAMGLKPKDRGDDWNHWWAERFENYGFIPTQVASAIELGCGPYTNMRCLLRSCRAKRVVLSDPLINTYLTFPLSFVRRLHQEGGCEIDDHPIEECPFENETFDVVLMINVLDHVRDAGLCIEQASRILRPGGWLVIGQAMTNASDLKALEGKPGETGHPIKIDDAWMDQHLAGRYQARIQKTLSREEGRDPEHHYGTYLFAGCKR
jgi:SAM-dependent methyltransferase